MQAGCHPPQVTFELGDILARPISIAFIALFITANLVLLGIVEPAARIANGADGATWFGPAKALVEYGTFGSLVQPMVPSADRGPVYPLTLAALMLVAGANYPALLAVLQATYLLVAALLTAAIAETYRKGSAPLTLGLMLFNPNLLGAVQLVQSEIVYLLVLTGILFLMLQFAANLNRRYSIWIGVLAGVAALTRPEGTFLIVGVPLFLLLIAVIQRARVDRVLSWPRIGSLCISCTLASCAVVAPWLLRNVQAGIGFRINEAQNAAHYAWGAVEQVIITQTGKTFWEVPKIVEAERNRQLAEFKGTRPDASEREIATRDFSNALTTLVTLPTIDHIKTIVKAKAEFILAGGAGIWIGLLRGTSNTPIAIMKATGANAYWSGWLDALSRYPIFELILTGIALGYVLVLRAFAVVGLWRAWQSSRLLLLILCAGIIFHTFIQPYYGPSRFRLPVEPAFVLLAVLALSTNRRLGKPIT